KGLGLMEGVERYAVGLNLGMIVALLVALLIYNMSLVVGGEWSLPELDSSVSGQDLRVLLGLLIVVQGFETSRYLGAKHPADERIETMRSAQLIASGIYLLFVLLATVLFQPSMGGDVTAILTMTAPVAIILPLLLSVAAVGSQFSAAVADTAGAGGLVGDLTNQKVSEKGAYALILAVTLALTWLVNVNEIIALASRAFALFYALQCLVATLVGFRKKDLRRVVGFLVLAVLCFLVCLLGVPAES
ncbi:hypothetical protein OAL23_01215, partial [bacterium]|nr:hypothetical protein [bacterium]